MQSIVTFEELDLLKEKDIDTYRHSLKVGKLALSMAFHLNLDQKRTRLLYNGCCLHDIGKLFVPDTILRNQEELEPSEWETMKSHPSLGAELLRKRSNVDQDIIDIVEFHHERWDGHGYPYGLKGADIPMFARICAIIDSFESMRSDRPYRKRLSLSQAKDELRNNSGTQFDKYYVDVFLSLPDTILDQ
ncbi:MULTISPECIES: HD-GYP domain-containing protein [unclassified Paenibacillus]|uniref:HD-GYP domain-containing protein n=1 Tax=unclassified Paenibacillus TaxID=185978 RepID=UPI001C101EF3|nr:MULTISPECIES: HD domain-containing phosphohydrolase [unclassified Paenibacillus]MBU5441350.1 HD domain-containing protein [Paenibacillus sp. MSJ-34]CAH0120918.1 Cyclic di-GMP phosphodiesterase [Paenibacillus sp. CECT 9249]